MFVAASTFFPFHAAADPDCVAAGPISPGLEKLVRDFQTADRAGRDALSVQDFLVGVTNIPASDEAALNRRGPVEAAKTGAGTGSIANNGRIQLEFQGIFARKQTFFKVPPNIKARYVTSADKVTLYYDSAGAIQVGEAVPLIDVPFYRTINHVIVSGDKLLFFWGSNTGPEADRCYVPG